jgi:DNA repair photolyase
MDTTPLTIKGRGTPQNPKNRFESCAFEVDDLVEPDPDEEAARGAGPQTTYLKDTARSIIAHNDSPDVGFEYSINPYRGCSHGCIYCYARPTHEYLGFSAGLDFETKVLVKEDAPELLRQELSRPRYQPKVLAISGVTDCYQPVERKLRLTRRCVELLAECRNPFTLITKNHLITRDLDVLAEAAKWTGVVAMLSVTSLDPDLTRVMEPRTSVPRRRLDAIAALAEAGVPVGVMVAPVVPGLTDHEVPQILKACADAGAKFCGYVPLRLPFAVKDLFEDWLGRHFPDRKDKVLNRIRELRGGKLNDSNFGSRMRGEGVWAEQLKAVFELAKRKAGLTHPYPDLRTDLFRSPAGPQMTLW